MNMNRLTRCRTWFCIAGLWVLCCVVSTAQAHKPSDSYLTLDFSGAAVQGQWDIALRDLDYALDLDRNDDRQITWGELRRQQQAIAVYALSRLNLRSDQQACDLVMTQLQVDAHSDGAYAVLRLGSDCSTQADQIQLDYQLFFDLDPTHQGLVSIRKDTQSQQLILSADAPAQSLQLSRLSIWAGFPDAIWQGIWHIWIGYDHILFLISLLLPSVLQWRHGHWQAVNALKPTVMNVLRLVTAFTVAHSITLALASLNWVTAPVRWVESAIAASVILAALNNMYPLIRRYLPGFVFVFGLIHGFGFASVLNDLGLGQRAIGLVLLGFNLGVELGQLALIAVCVPLVFSLRQNRLYLPLVLRSGSGAIALLATVWLLERSLNLEF